MTCTIDVQETILSASFVTLHVFEYQITGKRTYKNAERTGRKERLFLCGEYALSWQTYIEIKSVTVLNKSSAGWFWSVRTILLQAALLLLFALEKRIRVHQSCLDK